MNPQSSHTGSSPKTPVNPFNVTAGLLRNDIRLLPSLLLLLSFCAIAEALVAPTLWLTAADHIIQLAVMSIVVMRWRNRLQTGASSYIRLTTVAFRIFGIGLFLRLIVTIPKLLVLASQDPLHPSRNTLPLVLAMGALALASVWCVRMYFYYVVAGFVGGTWREIVARALRMHRQAPAAAIRALAAPLAISVLAVALFTLPYPDGRSLIWTTLASASQSIFWLLSTYTGLGFALCLFDSADWRAAGLEAYSLERLQTIETQGRSKLAGMLTPRSALKFAVLTTLTLIFITIRLTTEPPVVQIEVVRVVAADKAVHIELKATDNAFRFSSFKLPLVSLRSASGYPVSTDLTKASMNSDKNELLFEIPAIKTTAISLYLTFSTNRSKQDLEALEDLWLWYGSQPLAQIRKDFFSAP